VSNRGVRDTFVSRNDDRFFVADNDVKDRLSAILWYLIAHSPDIDADIDCCERVDSVADGTIFFFSVSRRDCETHSMARQRFGAVLKDDKTAGSALPALCPEEVLVPSPDGSIHVLRWRGIRSHVLRCGTTEVLKYSTDHIVAIGIIVGVTRGNPGCDLDHLDGVLIDAIR
jgi:hypothetical protein